MRRICRNRALERRLTLQYCERPPHAFGTDAPLPLRGTHAQGAVERPTERARHAFTEGERRIDRTRVNVERLTCTGNVPARLDVHIAFVSRQRREFRAKARTGTDARWQRSLRVKTTRQHHSQRSHTSGDVVGQQRKVLERVVTGEVGIVQREHRPLVLCHAVVQEVTD